MCRQRGAEASRDLCARNSAGHGDPDYLFAQVSTLSKAVRISDSMEPALVRLAHQECGGRGVGAIGMCLTGGFALSMALDPVVLAPVLAQPGLPVTRRGINPRHY